MGRESGDLEGGGDERERCKEASKWTEGDIGSGGNDFYHRVGVMLGRILAAAERGVTTGAGAVDPRHAGATRSIRAVLFPPISRCTLLPPAYWRVASDVGLPLLLLV